MFIFPSILRSQLRISGHRLFSKSVPLLLFKRQPSVKGKQPTGQSSELGASSDHGRINQRFTSPTGVSTAQSLNYETPASNATEGNVLNDDAKYDNHKILKRIPKFLRPYTTQFIYAPVSHVTAFLILHELTAIVPLVGVWYALHQYHDVFMSSTLDLPTWALEKGTKVIDEVLKEWDFADYSLADKMKFISEGAYAYVIVKAMFPLRLAVSLLGMPYFARWFVLPFTRLFGQKPAVKKNSESPSKPHAVKEVPKPRI